MIPSWVFIVVLAFAPVFIYFANDKRWAIKAVVTLVVGLLMVPMMVGTVERWEKNHQYKQTPDYWAEELPVCLVKGDIEERRTHGYAEQMREAYRMNGWSNITTRIEGVGGFLSPPTVEVIRAECHANNDRQAGGDS